MQEKTKEEWEQELDELLPLLSEFSSLLSQRPFQNYQGLRGVSAFALFYFLRKIRPTVVVEVGVWKGFSTWIIEKAVPNAQIFCYDPMYFLFNMLDRKKVGPIYRSPNAKYSGEDFSCIDVDFLRSAEKPLVFFDDHQTKLARLFQAKAAGVSHIIFDDNSSVEPFSHRTLEHEKDNPASVSVMNKEIDKYQIFPALWDFEFPKHQVSEKGLRGMPIKDEFQYIYNERKWHSYVTYIHLNEPEA